MKLNYILESDTQFRRDQRMARSNDIDATSRLFIQLLRNKQATLSDFQVLSLFGIKEAAQFLALNREIPMNAENLGEFFEYFLYCSHTQTMANIAKLGLKTIGIDLPNSQRITAELLRQAFRDYTIQDVQRLFFPLMLQNGVIGSELSRIMSERS